MSHKHLKTLTILMLAWCLIVACSDTSGPPRTTTTPDANDPTPHSAAALSGAAVVEDAPQADSRPSQEDTPQAASSPPQIYGNVPEDRHEGMAAVSLEERIYLSNVVVKARLLSAANDVLRFRSIRYLKGTGPSIFTVRAKTAGRDTQWDNQDAVLFLKALNSKAQDFEFIDTTSWDYMWPPYNPTEYTGVLPEGYTVGNRNPVWLPAGSAGAARSADTAGIVTEYSGSTPVTVSQTELSERIQWVEGPSAGSASDGLRSAKTPSVASDAWIYEGCIIQALMMIRYERDYEAFYGEVLGPHYSDKTISSGAAAGRTILDFGTDYSSEYHRFWLTGPDAGLFVAQINDNDQDALNGYNYAMTTARPLPSGTYEVQQRAQLFHYTLCKYASQNAQIALTINAEAPPRTIHEAFFDPAALTAGAGFAAASTARALRPAQFGTTSITGLSWHNGQVSMTLNPVGALVGHDLSFIALDGSVALTLDPDVATTTAGTLTWAVSPQPWQTGDQLMLRIKKDRPAPE